MQPQYLGIFSKHEFINEQGEVIKRWYKVGYLKMTENGGKFIRLFHQPQHDYFCFENEATEPLIPTITLES